MLAKNPESVGTNVSMFNAEQKAMFDYVMALHEAYTENEPRIIFDDVPAGTGKTYVFNISLQAFRSQGSIALAVASIGTALLLLNGGRTSHPMFRIPVRIENNSVCSLRHLCTEWWSYRKSPCAEKFFYFITFASEGGTKCLIKTFIAC